MILANRQWQSFRCHVVPLSATLTEPSLLRVNLSMSIWALRGTSTSATKGLATRSRIWSALPFTAFGRMTFSATECVSAIILTALEATICRPICAGRPKPSKCAIEACSNNKTGLRGVRKRKKKFVAELRHQKKTYYLGTHSCKLAAAKAYIHACKQICAESGRNAEQELERYILNAALWDAKPKKKDRVWGDACIAAEIQPATCTGSGCELRTQ
eukprot:COSAG01_NODE_12249_length_1773_cov_57.006571_2_plen_215_part_00